MATSHKTLTTPLLIHGEHKEYGDSQDFDEYKQREVLEHKIAIVSPIRAELLKEAKELEQAILLLTRLIRKKNAAKNVFRGLAILMALGFLGNMLARLPAYFDALDIYGNTKVKAGEKLSTCSDLFNAGSFVPGNVGTPTWDNGDMCHDQQLLNFLTHYSDCNSTFLDLCSVVLKMGIGSSPPVLLGLGIVLPIAVLIIDYVWEVLHPPSLLYIVDLCFEKCTKITNPEAKSLTQIKTKYDMPDNTGLENLLKTVKTQQKYLDKKFFMNECRFAFATATSGADTVILPRTFLQFITCRKPKIQTNHLKNFLHRLGPDSKAGICKKIFEYAGLRVPKDEREKENRFTFFSASLSPESQLGKFLRVAHDKDKKNERPIPLEEISTEIFEFAGIAIQEEKASPHP